MINPNRFEPKYKKSLSPRFAGGKMYVPFIGKPLGRQFRRASEAEAYAKRIHARWCRLYNAAVLALAEVPAQEPTA